MNNLETILERGRRTKTHTKITTQHGKPKWLATRNHKKNEMTPGAHKGLSVPVFFIKQPHLTDISYHPCAQCALSNYLQYM